MIDLTPIFQAVIALLAALVTYKLIPWIKARTTQEQQATLSAAVKIAVYAAEEVYRAGNGSDKLKYAQKWLHNKGYEVDVTTIEAAVNQMRDAKLLTEAVTIVDAESGTVEGTDELE